ncbi:MAG: sulfatase activating formylglycine-generating enzyme [Myxococcota bacterium]|jgi:formylglycine-generating enzyme required for sulfatase activity/tRNA A-37 threonylcarbamoyl transferase component Bud32
MPVDPPQNRAAPTSAVEVGPVDETYYQPVTLVVPELDEAAPSAGPMELPPRYTHVSLLGTGGMGEVHLVHDHVLRRDMAMKIIRADLLHETIVRNRFIEEAQVTAQLAHPGIVPVYDLDRLPDGRLFFTMQVVAGRTFSRVLREGEWSLRRLVDAWLRVCQAVAYAHSRGVVHRDLKPSNVMIGAFGEVQVLDWGVAKIRGFIDRAAAAGELAPVSTDRNGHSEEAPGLGSLAGTPAYMSPEQASGEVGAIDERSDVYALGTILYEILAGKRAYAGRSAQEVLAAVRAGAPRPVSVVAAKPLPDELVSAVQRAMARQPAQRFANALELAEEVGAWLEGARRRARARVVVAEAASRVPDALRLRSRAAALMERAAELLEEVPPWAPESEKLEGWTCEDTAAELERRADRLELEREQLLQGALTHAPNLPEAHAALAEVHRGALIQAEERRDRDAAERAVLRLWEHVRSLPSEHPERARQQAFLDGTGALTLYTDPPGALVTLYRYMVRNRRLEPVEPRLMGATPLKARPLPMGSYLCIIEAPGHEPVRYPVFIGRGEHWDGVRPGSSAPTPIRLPRRGALDPNDRYVPSGWFLSGGDPEAHGSLPRRRLWVDGFVMRQFPVTQAEFIRYLDDLVATGQEHKALRRQPASLSRGEIVDPTLRLDAEGRFHLTVDDDGDEWLPDWPVIMVDWFAARGYARWLSTGDGKSWRLPGELEWEKAARGADGRVFPWGNTLDPSWCHMSRSHATDHPLPSVVDSYPVDTSPYGIRGLGGNTYDWCADPYDAEGPTLGDEIVPRSSDAAGQDLRVRRGGAFNGQKCRAAFRIGSQPTWRDPTGSFRLVRSVHTDG